MRKLRASLAIGDGKVRTTVVSAVHGLGGVGKTTLVAKVARDLGEKGAFADGIRWLTLGEEPTEADILRMLGVLVAYFGDGEHRPRRIADTSDHLKGMLADKEALIILDDAWQVGHVRPFLVGGPRCRVVVTTRDKVIADEASARLVDLDVMSDAEAVRLIAGLLGRRLTSGEKQPAHDLARAVGYLPIALELAAAKIVRGVSWSALFEDLRREPTRLDAIEDPRRLHRLDKAGRRKNSIRVCFNLSVRRLSVEDREKFAWLGVLKKETTMTAPMVTTLWGMAERDAMALLHDLRDQALLKLGPPRADRTPTFHIHDLMRAIAVKLLTDTIDPPTADDLPGLGLSPAEAHGRFLDRYRHASPEAPWHTVADDGYLHDHLVWHLEQAGRLEEIHQLFEREDEAGHNGWFRTREDRGADAAFIADLIRAWQLADDALQLADEAGPAPLPVVRQCRCALILSSLNSLASKIPTRLLTALVESGGWTLERALANARRVPDPLQRIHAFAALMPAMDDLSRKSEITAEALAAARGLGDDWQRARRWRRRRPAWGRPTAPRWPRRWRWPAASATTGSAPGRWRRWRRT